MKILLTNDDGFQADGLIALENFLGNEHDVFTVAPLTEQSGISGAITFLRPLFPRKFSTQERPNGYSVNGTPTDCVKLGLFKLCPWQPDMVISGINGGLNAGINTAYSGTVGGALEAARFDVPSFAVSLEFEESMQYDRAAEIAFPLIQKIYDAGAEQRIAYNINVPTSALINPYEVRCVPMESNRHGHHFESGFDPKRRKYYWATNFPLPEPSAFETDTQALAAGNVTVTPLDGDLTCRASLGKLDAIDGIQT